MSNFAEDILSLVDDQVHCFLRTDLLDHTAINDQRIADRFLGGVDDLFHEMDSENETDSEDESATIPPGYDNKRMPNYNQGFLVMVDARVIMITIYTSAYADHPFGGQSNTATAEFCLEVTIFHMPSKKEYEDEKRRELQEEKRQMEVSILGALFPHVFARHKKDMTTDVLYRLLDSNVANGDPIMLGNMVQMLMRDRFMDKTICQRMQNEPGLIRPVMWNAVDSMPSLDRGKKGKQTKAAEESIMDKLAVCMSQQSRLGSGSPMRVLDTYMLEMILDNYSRIPSSTDTGGLIELLRVWIVSHPVSQR
jgi:hypothetical protein